MDVEYLIGSPEKFHEFVNSIGISDKVAVLTHIDLDGLASGLFLEKILEAKGINVDYLDFLDVKSEMVKNISQKLRDLGITKVFFCDVAIDSVDSEGFLELREEMDVFLIDHHPFDEDLHNFKNVIKTESSDCSAMTIFDLGKGIIDYGEWQWLNCAAIFSDYSYKKEKNFLHLQNVYPEITKENISFSVPGINARKINSALIYYEHNQKYVYDLVKARKMDKVSEVHELIEDEINRLVDEFSVGKEYFPDRDLYFYEVQSKFNVLSSVATILSKMKVEGSFVFMQRRNGLTKISSRNQSGSENMGELMRRCVSGLSSAVGGGHSAAAAAKIRSEDLDEFKKKLLNPRL